MGPREKLRCAWCNADVLPVAFDDDGAVVCPPGGGCSVDLRAVPALTPAPRGTLSAADVASIRRRARAGEREGDIARGFGVTADVVALALRGAA
jgi:hypothetical protein